MIFKLLSLILDEDYIRQDGVAESDWEQTESNVRHELVKRIRWQTGCSKEAAMDRAIEMTRPLRNGK